MAPSVMNLWTDTDVIRWPRSVRLRQFGSPTAMRSYCTAPVGTYGLQRSLYCVRPFLANQRYPESFIPRGESPGNPAIVELRWLLLLFSCLRVNVANHSKNL